VKQEGIDAIEGLTKMGIAVYNPDGTLRQLAEIIKDIEGITYRVPVSSSAASSSLKDIIQKISDNRIREARQGKEGEA
jgi:hypothetical protein